MPRVAFLAEASPLIGTGHVREAFALAAAARAEGMEVGLWLNTATSASLLAHAPCTITLLEGFEPDACRALGEELSRRGFAVALVNFRRAGNDQVTALAASGTAVVVIDELGGSELDCDAVINNSLVASRHHYASSRPDFRICPGAEYMALGDEYRAEHDRDRHHAGPLRAVAVTFGGTDRIGTTSKVVEALSGWRLDLRKHVVLGGGFTRRVEGLHLLASDPSFVVHENLPTLAPLLSSCDAAFTCGGNTLYELACVGTPSIVLYEEPHEREAALAFEEQGFGVCLGAGMAAEKDEILRALASLDDPARRQAHCDAGKRIVDGRGTERILGILRDLVSRAPAHPHEAAAASLDL